MEYLNKDDKKKLRDETDRLVERIAIAKNQSVKIKCLVALCLHLQHQIEDLNARAKFWHEEGNNCPQSKDLRDAKK